MGGRADAAADVSCQTERGAAGRDDRTFAAAAAAARPLEVPRVVRPAEERIVSLLVEEQLGHVGLADDDRSRLAQAGDQRAVRGLQHVLAGRQPEGRRQPGDVELLLDGDRDAAERPEGLAALARGVDRIGFEARLVEAPRDDGVQPHIHRLDLGDVRVHDGARGDRAVGDQPSQLARAAPRQLMLDCIG